MDTENEYKRTSDITIEHLKCAIDLLLANGYSLDTKIVRIDSLCLQQYDKKDRAQIVGDNFMQANILLPEKEDGMESWVHITKAAVTYHSSYNIISEED